MKKKLTLCCSLLLCFSGIIPMTIGCNEFEISLGLCHPEINLDNSFFPSGEILIEIENDEEAIISRQIIMNKQIRDDQNLIIKNIPKIEIVDTPNEFSWKNYNEQDWTTPAKNQGNCGSCWDFAAVGALESIINIRENNPDLDIDLSEQYILSCLPAAANIYGEGCSGGNPYNAYFYIMNTSEEGNNCNGIITEKCFPYQADDKISCTEKCDNWRDFLIPISDCGYCWTGNITTSYFDSDARDIIKSQIFQFGPIAAALNITTSCGYWGLMNHDPNDYYPYVEQLWGYFLNHLVVIIGWKDDPSIPNGGYWICKNSYGSDWGYDGFFNLEYECMFIGLFISWVDYNPNYNFKPNKPSTPVGPTSGKAETNYEYTFVAEDLDGDDIYYLVDWGDDSINEWFGPYKSGEEATVKHRWFEQGEYIIKAKAKDVLEAESDWSDPLSVSMPRNKLYSDRPFLKFLQNIMDRFPLLARLLKLL
jgi:C1A family cysteine protease